VAESTVRWFIVREKHCWMAADSAEPAKCTFITVLDGLRLMSFNLYPTGTLILIPDKIIKGSVWKSSRAVSMLNLRVLSIFFYLEVLK
jgi:hypothetical protein